MKESVLILKRVSNDFDKYVCQSLQDELDNVTVIDPFRLKGRIGNKIINFVKNHNKETLFNMCLRINKKSVKNYNTVIIFDDYPDIKLLKWINKYNSNCKIKLWFWNVPNYSIEGYRPYCKMYCFDEAYSLDNNITFINQFYFWNVPIKINDKPNFDISFVGVDKNRYNKLYNLSTRLDILHLSYNFQLITNVHKNSESIRILNKPLLYNEVLDVSNDSRAILELVTENQHGLTWRALEALYLRKKLITNNRDIIHFDFYCENNVFILGLNSIEDLAFFLEQPYVEINPEIKEKYSIKNWFYSINAEYN